jgi:tetratricopeptide (TPR) repeat protein
VTNVVRLVALFLGAGLTIAHPGDGAAFNDVTAGSGVAVGRDVTNSTLNAYSRDPADVQQIARLLADRDTLAAARHEAELRAEKLAGEAQTTKQQMLIFLSILAKQEVKPEQVPATMAEITRNYQRQQDHYATLAPQDPGAADLVRRAKQATDAGRFDEADRLLEQAVDRETAAVVEHQIKVAELMAARGDNAATQLHYSDAAKHYEAAAAQLPPSASDTKAFYLLQAGDMRQTSGNLAAALTSYQASLAIRDRLAKADPGNAGWQRDLSVSQEKIGDVQQAQGDLAAALTSYQASLAIRDRLAKADPGNAGWQRDLSVSQEKIGDVQQAQGDLAAALTSHQASLAIADRLATADPGNAGWQRDLSVSQEKIGDVQQAQGDLAAALTSYQASFAIRDRLAKADPGNAGWQRDLSVSHNKIGAVLRVQGDLPGALTAYRDSLAIRRALALKDPTNTDWQRDLANNLTVLSWVLLLDHRPQEALDHAQKALAIDSTALASEINRAHALLLLGRFDEAKAIYLAEQGDAFSTSQTVAEVIKEDFAELRKYGIDTPAMKAIKALLTK